MRKYGFRTIKFTKGRRRSRIISTNYGDIKVRFFPEIAPKAVENFKTHSRNGYYDNVTFHRVMNEFMIQGGDPQGLAEVERVFGVSH